MKFEDLEAWKQVQVMTNQIYRICKQNPLAREYALSDQLRRAAISVMANLAEGFERVHKAEKIQLWIIARASAGEVRSLLYILSDNNIVRKSDLRPLFDQTNRVSSLCSGLIRSYRHRH